MRSAIAFLPPCMMTFMNLASSTLPYLGSGRISRLGTSRRRGISHLLICFSLPFRAAGAWAPSGNPLTRPTGNMPASGHYADSACQGRMSTDKLPGCLGLLRALGAVLRTGLLAILHALQVQRTTHDVITHTGQVLHAAAAHEHHRV